MNHTWFTIRLGYGVLLTCTHKGHVSFYNAYNRLCNAYFVKALKDASSPLRQCKACHEMGHHDSRNCHMLKEMSKEKKLSKGKRKA